MFSLRIQYLLSHNTHHTLLKLLVFNVDLSHDTNDCQSWEVKKKNTYVGKLAIESESLKMG